MMVVPVLEPLSLVIIAQEALLLQKTLVLLSEVTEKELVQKPVTKETQLITMGAQVLELSI